MFPDWAVFARNHAFEKDDDLVTCCAMELRISADTRIRISKKSNILVFIGFILSDTKILNAGNGNEGNTYNKEIIVNLKPDD